MCARANQPDDPRDQAMARLLANAVKPTASSGDGPGLPAVAGKGPLENGPGKGPRDNESCPDAGLVAAYADQGLADNERVQLESHFAGCARCQRMLAALGAALETPAGASVAVTPAPAGPAAAPQPAARPVPVVQRWLWWLSPAFGAAAAALLWMALRPATPEPVQTAATFRTEEAQEARPLNAPAAPLPETSPPARVLRDEVAADRLAKAQPAETESAAGSREQALAQLAEPLGGALSVAPPPPSVRSEVAPPAAPQAAVAQTMIAPPVAESAAPGAVPPSPARNEIAGADSRASLEARTAGASGAIVPQQVVPAYRADAQAAQEAKLILYTFSPPTGGATWRLGAGGLIERSTDQGRTWHAQSSGVTSDLIAGSASSADVAWVVGRGRVILRTTDGQRWERIAAPPDVTGEWAAVAAYDALTATVVADDLRRYSTQDGGETWTLQQ